MLGQVNAYIITARYMFWPTAGAGHIALRKGSWRQRWLRTRIGRYEEIINNPRVDVFDNVTPDASTWSLPSLGQGRKHVVCEKPLAVGAGCQECWTL